MTAPGSMRERSSWSTDKAEFTRQDGRLTKRYLRRGLAARDATLLKLIEDRYRPFRRDGWTYRALRVHAADPARNTLTMEYLAGPDLKALFGSTRDPSLFEHAGRWLGGLHAAGSREGPARVITFNDFNCSNVIVDKGRREVVSIDPGAFTHPLTRPGVSLAIGALSAGRVSMRLDPRLVPRCLSAYLRGYLESDTSRMLPPLWPGWAYVVHRIYEGKARSLLGRGARAPALIAGVAESAFWAVLTSALGLVVQAGMRRTPQRDEERDGGGSDQP